MVVRVLSSRRHEDIHFSCRDAAAINPADVQLRADVERGDCALEQFFADAGVEQGAKHHVSADSRKALEVSNAH